MRLQVNSRLGMGQGRELGDEGFAKAEQDVVGPGCARPPLGQCCQIGHLLRDLQPRPPRRYLVLAGMHRLRSIPRLGTVVAFDNRQIHHRLALPQRHGNGIFGRVIAVMRGLE